jgi:hypothetical protein
VQRAAAHDEAVVVAEERVVLDLVRVHRAVAAVELQADAVGQRLADRADRAALVGLRPARRGLEVHAVGVGLDQRRAEALEARADELEHLAAAPGDLVGRGAVGEQRHLAGAEVPVGAVHDELHRRLHRRVVPGRERAGLGGARERLVLEPQRGEPGDDVVERADLVARRPDPERADDRGVEARDVGLHDARGDARRVEHEPAARVR